MSWNGPSRPNKLVWENIIKWNVWTQSVHNRVSVGSRGHVFYRTADKDIVRELGLSTLLIPAKLWLQYHSDQVYS